MEAMVAGIMEEMETMVVMDETGIMETMVAIVTVVTVADKVTMADAAGGKSSLPGWTSPIGAKGRPMLLDQAITRLFGTSKARNKIYTRSLPRRYKYFVLRTGSRMITTSQQRRGGASCIAMRPAIGSFIDCVPLDHSHGAMITVEENEVVRFAQRNSRDSCPFAVYYAIYRIQLQLIILTVHHD
jgi:hypothetical protein